MLIQNVEEFTASPIFYATIKKQLVEEIIWLE